MARYDKYEPFGGGFRAPIDINWTKEDLNKAFAVGLNASGRVVKGEGQTGVLGVLVLTSVKNAGDIVDVMTSGEIVEMTDVTAGTVLYGATDGTISATTGGTRLGHTVEATRMIVRAVPAGAAA